MKEYVVTITEVDILEEGEVRKDIYSQVFEELDIPGVVKRLNGGY